MKTTCLLLWLALPAMAQGQGAVPTAEPPILSAHGAFFALSVQDADASAKWYSEKLGLKLVRQEPKRDKVAVAILEGGGLIVELIQHDDASPLSTAAPGAKDALSVHGIFKVGILVDDFEKTLARLKERQVPIAYGPYPAKEGQRANVIIRDNAGNLIQLFGR